MSDLELRRLERALAQERSAEGETIEHAKFGPGRVVRV